MVEENEITQRAKERAAEITEAAQQECARLRQETLANLSQLLEHADIGMSAQLDALRSMRQQLGASYPQQNSADYNASAYSDNNGYNE